MSDSRSLDGRRVLVTGGASGIGRAVALGCLESGATVFSIDNNPSIAALARSGLFVGVCDVRSYDQVRTMVEEASTTVGGLDAVVNSAGVLRLGPVVDGDVGEWRLMIETNLLGLLHVTHAALQYLTKEKHADLVNVSSLSGRRVAHSQAAVYTATKAAVHALTEAMRAELASHSIRTTVVAPGAVKTSLSEGISDASLRAEIRGVHDSVGLEPTEVAEVIVNVLAAKPGTLITEIGIQSTGHAASGVT